MRRVSLHSCIHALRRAKTAPPCALSFVSPASPSRICSNGLADVPDLVRRTRSTGRQVTYTSLDADVRLSPALDLAAYRIVQEALTNVARHAGASASAAVSITIDDAVLTVQVDDDGQNRRSNLPGHPIPGLGIIGMRERAAGLGGRLSARVRDDGGFRVRAELPLEHPA